MTPARALHFVVRNWPLKLGAIALSVVLYAGLVVAQNARVWPGPIPIEAVKQPAGSFLLNSLGDVTSIRYLAPVDVATSVTSRDFVATADLSNVPVQAGGVPVSVPVTVSSLDPRIQVIGWTPTVTGARLDPVITRVVPVEVERGPVPPGLTASQPTVDRTTVTVRGAASLVQQVAAAVARVSIDASGVNVDSEVDLVAVDARGETVGPLTITPSRVNVKILVAEQLSSRTLPVSPNVTGQPALGYAIRRIEVTPITVTVSGSDATLGALSTISTAAININNRTTDLQANVALQPPNGVTPMGSSTVSVHVVIDPLSGSRSFGAGIVLSNASSGLVYTPSVPDVLVTLAGTQATLDAVDPTTLTASVDVSGLGPGTYTLPVRVRLPTGTTLVAASPAQIEVTVEAPAPAVTPTPTPTPSGGP